MFKTIKEAFKIKDVRKKILLTLFLLLVYRIGCWLPTPGIALSAFQTSVSSGGDFLSIISAVSGNALSNGAILALGVVPYINSSIIMQLLTVAIPALEKLSKQGEDGKKEDCQIYPNCCTFLGNCSECGHCCWFWYRQFGHQRVLRLYIPDRGFGCFHLGRRCNVYRLAG